MRIRTLALGALAAGGTVLFIGCSSTTKNPATTTANGTTSSSPSGQEAANAKKALVRFVNAIPNRSSDLWFGDQDVFSDVAYKTVTPYKELADERHDFKLTAAGRNGAPEVTESKGLTKGSHYTVIATLDKRNQPKLDVITDDLAQASNDRAKVRIINASADKVDVIAPAPRTGRENEGTADRYREGTANRMRHPESTNTWFSGVGQVSATSYKDVDPMNGNLEIRPADRPGRRVEAPVDLASGKLYTLVVTGGERGAPLSVIRVEDELNGAR